MNELKEMLLEKEYETPFTQRHAEIINEIFREIRSFKSITYQKKIIKRLVKLVDEIDNSKE